MVDKVRADLLLVERGLAETRSKARALIMAGEVVAGERRVEKAGELLPRDVTLRLKGVGHRYVSRGGLKLEAGLRAFHVDPSGLRCLDVGASTGGFTDCLLQHGAREVVAVDVGYGQLHHRLRSDPRVTVLERTNARHLDPQTIGGTVSLCVADCSFISLTLLLPPIATCLEADGQLVALVKPQFEVGRSEVGRGGVVRDERLRRAALERVAAAAVACGFSVAGHLDSPVPGPKGNVEWLLYARKAHG